MSLVNNEARKLITDTYDYNTCKEIVNNGCASGVCSEYIYDADTNTFFDKYEDEVLTDIEQILGEDALVDLFKQAYCDITRYKTLVVWTFIELVAMDVVTEMERIEYEQDELIESYMLPTELQESAEDLMNLSVYNPPSSMTDYRYANA